MEKLSIGERILIASAVIVVALSGFFAFRASTTSTKMLGSVNMISDRNYIDAFGTATSPATLSSTNATSSALRIQGLSNLVLAGTYLPKAANSTLFLTLERSIDYGQTWYPYDTITPSTDRVSVWSNGFVTSSSAVPFVIPGSLSSTSGTAITFSFDQTLAADYVRVLAKESTAGTPGTFNVELFSTNH